MSRTMTLDERDALIDQVVESVADLPYEDLLGLAQQFILFAAVGMPEATLKKAAKLGWQAYEASLHSPENDGDCTSHGE